MGFMVPQPACAAAAAAAVLWNRHGASIITSIITATQHRATETRKVRIEGCQNGTYEIYLQLVHTGRLRGVIERGRVVRGKKMKKKMGGKKKKKCSGFAVVVFMPFSFSCLQREESCAISFFPQLIISRHVSKHC